MSASSKIVFPTVSEFKEVNQAELSTRESTDTGSASKASATSLSSQSSDELHFQMATQLRAFKYHPVVLFGNSACGKTSLITSLLAALKLEPEWEMGATLNESVVPINTDYGRIQHEEANRLFNRVVQEFIAGKGADATKAQVPFFVPVSVRSGILNQTLKLAFMESNGESYSPNLQSDNFFATLRKDTEAFVREYEGGISFIYVLPYTQINVRGLDENSAEDPARLRLAELAVVGILQAYERIRIHKANDSHLLLISKWDAHFDARRQDEEIPMSDILADTYSDIELFLKQTYPQAFATFQGLSVPRENRKITNYCAGLMTGRKIQPVSEDYETRIAIRAHQAKIWRWIWCAAQGDPGGSGVSPIPDTRMPRSAIDRAFDWLSRRF